MKQEDKTYINEYLKKHNISSNELMWMCYMGKLADLTESQLDLYMLEDIELMQREYIRIALMLKINPDEAVKVRSINDVKELLLKNQETFKQQSKEQDVLSALADIKKMQEKILNKSEESVNISNKLVKSILKIPDFEIMSKMADKKVTKIIENIEMLLSGKEASEPEDTEKNIISKLADKIKRRDKKKQPEDIFSMLAESNFSKAQATEIIDGLKNGLSAEDVMSYAKEEYSPEKMSELKEFLLMVKAQKENENADSDSKAIEQGMRDDKNKEVVQTQNEEAPEKEYIFTDDGSMEQTESAELIYDEDFEEYEEE